MRNSKNHSDQNKSGRESIPAMAWQTGEYTRDADFNFILPYPFLLLCKLMEVTPAQILADFMDNLSCGSWNREGRDHAKTFLIEYFIAHRYGQSLLTVEEIRRIFKELDAIGSVWPVHGSMELIEQTAKWRNEYYQYWFDKWLPAQKREVK